MKRLTYYISMTPRPEERPVIHLSQGDTDWAFTAYLYSERGNLAIEAGTTARLICRRPDGSELTGALDFVDIAGRADIPDELKSGITEIAGRGVCEIELTYDGRQLYSENAILDIEPNPRKTATTEDDEPETTTTTQESEEAEP